MWIEIIGGTLTGAAGGLNVGGSKTVGDWFAKRIIKQYLKKRILII